MSPEPTIRISSTDKNRNVQYTELLLWDKKAVRRLTKHIAVPLLYLCRWLTQVRPHKFKQIFSVTRVGGFLVVTLIDVDITEDYINTDDATARE